MLCRGFCFIVGVFCLGVFVVAGYVEAGLKFEVGEGLSYV